MALLKDIFAGFYTTIKGMIVTGKEVMVPAITVQYPYAKREYAERMRGMLVNDASTCIACGRCVKACPVLCIKMEYEGKGKERRPVVFEIDYIKCCWCSLCCEVCPVESLYMSHDIETVFTDRTMMVRDFCKDPIPSKKIEAPAAEPAPVAENETKQ
ncbi:MAG: 4Fe-4S dicluster domain-containing protein [bacterium]|jgi:formate hydrogenlyase subunit 6/NADH:ubiquinone oxidoreductase subunit I|nr:4Fe-4S dicluster domain-containing protein [bacterium]